MQEFAKLLFITLENLALLQNLFASYATLLILSNQCRSRSYFDKSNCTQQMHTSANKEAGDQNYMNLLLKFVKSIN